MKKYFEIIFRLVLSCLFLAGSSSAQEKMNLSIEQSIEIGLKSSKALHSSLMNVQSTEAKAGEVNATRLPSLKFGGGYTRLSNVPPFTTTIPASSFGQNLPPQNLNLTFSQTVLDNYSMRLSLQQPLFTGFRLQSNYEIADLTAQAADQDFKKDKANLTFDIRNAYWNLYKAIEFKKVIDENVEQVKSHVNDVTNLMNQGMATRNDLLRVQVQLSSAELTQIDAENNVHLATIALNNVIGQPLTTVVEPVSVPDSSHQSLQNGFGDINKLTELAIQSRPELKGMQFRVQASEAAVTLAKSGWYPQVYLTGNYYYARPNQRIFPTLDQFRDTWDLGISLSWDVWNWGTTVHQTDQAQALLSQTQDALGQLRDAVALEVTQNYLNAGQAKERIGVSEQAVHQAEENYRVTNEKFKLGLVLNSDMLDAEASLLQAKWNHIQALVDYELATARLQKSIGEQ